MRHFSLNLNKGEKSLDRPARKRGGKAKKRGLSSEQIPVLIIRDRSGATSDAILPTVSSAALSDVLTHHTSIRLRCNFVFRWP